MLLIRRHATVLIQNADSELEGCMAQNKETYEQQKNLVNRDALDQQ